jgi:hypothetical protein
LGSGCDSRVRFITRPSVPEVRPTLAFAFERTLDGSAHSA